MEELETNKSKGKNTLLVILIVILILAVGALSYYTFFIYEKEEVVVEEEDNKLTASQVSEVLFDFEYEKLLNAKDKTKGDLTDEELLYIGYSGLEEDDMVLGEVGTCDEPEDDDALVKCIMKNLNLSSDKIKVADTTLWKNILSGSTSYKMVSKDILLDEISKRTGKELVASESFAKYTSGKCSQIAFVYDKNVDMIFIKEDGGCAGYPYAIEITDSYKEGDTYVIGFVKGMFEMYDDKNGSFYKLYAESNPSVFLKEGVKEENATPNSLKDLVVEYKDKLDNYKLSFKKVGDTYQFVSVDYVE